MPSERTFEFYSVCCYLGITEFARSKESIEVQNHRF